MPTTLNLDPALLQEAINLDTSISLDTIVEQALRDYIRQHSESKSGLGFGESLMKFRQDHNLDQVDLNPDEIWGGVRDRNFTGKEVTFE
ncbi:MAG: type II toxin-antitoxin system CcdA family antitoxin [Alkalinema sp. CAN_BIN05]|nr:type II toxin-antitoxin system CcdA family antitoxin [Alkalinema sp. CAN_BIN05]